MSATASTPKPTPNSNVEASSVSRPAVKTAKLFKNGRSQAVRLPKEFRFEGTEVAIRRDPATGEVVLLQPEDQPAKSWQEWFDVFDSLDIPDDVFEREVHMPTERDLF
jgi:antitoxin VapB